MDTSANGNTAPSELDPFHRGTNQSGMRAYNERLVLSLIRRHGAVAKTDIARMTGLSAQTVSVIVRELEADGLLIKGAPVRGKVGQPSTPMSLNPGGALFLGLKIGRRSADLVLVDFLGRIVDSLHCTYRYPTPEATVRFARQSLDKVLAALGAEQRSRIGGLGIALPFQLWNWAEKIGAPPEAMETWRGADIRADIASGLDFPVYLQNDASAACGAELVFGQSHADERDFIYFYVGFFIGGGIVLNGSLHTGRTGNAGAFGSMPVPDGKGGTCQLIDVASIATLEWALEAAGLDASVLWGSSPVWDVDPGFLDPWIEKTAGGLAFATVSAASVVEIESVVIDGWMPLSVRRAIVEAVHGRLRTINLAGIEPPRIREGTVGRNARALGAASLPLSQRFLVDQNAFLKDR